MSERRGDAETFAGLAAEVERIAVGEAAEGWRPFATLMSPNARFQPDGPTRADEPMLIYFTSGAPARPKLVIHSRASYPIGHLSTMYGLGLKPGDVHLNVSSPGRRSSPARWAAPYPAAASRSSTRKASKATRAEIALPLRPRAVGLMRFYQRRRARSAGSSCAAARPRSPSARNGLRRSSGSRIFPKNRDVLDCTFSQDQPRRRALMIAEPRLRNPIESLIALPARQEY
jgi:hypothetical protein